MAFGLVGKPHESPICFFADDSLIFGDVSVNGAVVIKEILEAYAKCSGQEVNLD